MPPLRPQSFTPIFLEIQAGAELGQAQLKLGFGFTLFELY